MSIFDDMGIIADTNLSSFERERDKYQKIDSSLFETVDQSLKMIPTLIDAKLYNSDVYRVIYNKGYGVLQKSAKYPGMLLANVVEKETNNGIKEQARLQTLSNAPQVLGAAFNVMSIVTGQYYMSRIESRLKHLEHSVGDILAYFEETRRSELLGRMEFLKETRKRMSYFVDDAILSTSTLCSVQSVRINAIEKLYFYQSKISSTIDTLSEEKDSIEEIMRNINEMLRLIYEYWIALLLFCEASSLEVQISHNQSPSFIHEVEEDIESKKNTYEEQHQVWKEGLKQYVEKAGAFEENEIIRAIADANPIFVGIMPKLVAKCINKCDAKKKEKSRRNLIDEIVLKAPETSVEPILEIQKELSLLEQIYMDRLEIVKIKDEMYYRIDFEEPIKTQQKI